MSAVGFIGQARGVLREVWYNVDMDLNRTGTMRQYPVFKTPPRKQTILREFDAPFDEADKYVQRLTSYLQVNVQAFENVVVMTFPSIRHKTERPTPK